MLFIDTDSLVYEIKTEDVYEDFSEDKSLFDFSDYLQDLNFLILSIKKLSVKWKMNSKEKIIGEQFD